jgi:hypothetical protein
MLRVRKSENVKPELVEIIRYEHRDNQFIVFLEAGCKDFAESNEDVIRELI